MFKSEETITGKKLSIRFLDGASDSLQAVLDKHGNEKKHQKWLATLSAALCTFAEQGNVTCPMKVSVAGVIPKSGGTAANKLSKKRKNLRLYGWYSDKYPKVFIVSHFAWKLTEKTSKKDLNILSTNWNRVEGEENE